MKRFWIECTGCPRRWLDTENVSEYLIANGYQETEDPKEADYLFLMSCGFIEPAEENSIRFIREAKNYPGELILCGCLPSMNEKRVRKLHQGKIINTTELEKIDQYFPEFKIKFSEIASADANKPHRKMQLISPNELEFKEEIFSLRISRGCLGNCAYCNINKAIGRLKSKPIDLLLSELRKGIAQNEFHLNIISCDTGSYGLDIGGTIPELLEAILDEDPRITIDYIEDFHPKYLCRYKDQLIKIFGKKRIQGILAPVQSGSERILRLMNRPTDLTFFKEAIKEFHRADPDLLIRSQVIAGLPTETEAEFQETIDFIREAGFSEVGIFKYHEVENMQSYAIHPKVPEEEAIRRMKKFTAELSAQVRIRCNL